jgi:hypothetical protein
MMCQKGMSAPLSRLGKRIAEAVAALNAIDARFALIGGLALASYHVVRATQDVELLADAEQADAIDSELAKLGYRRLHRSADAANYARGDERIDLLYARRRSRTARCRVPPRWRLLSASFRS